MSLSSTPPSTAEPSNFISIGLEDVLHRVRALASLDDPVLITGETGTGKEVIARLIHEHSGRTGQLIGVNSAAISESLAGAELFGHEKGAFTGAHQSRRGYLREAENGTLLLDEIGDLSREIQAALLRVLEQREFFPVGSARPVPTNARIIAATNKDIADLDKGFRSDLYHRFPFRIKLPPLRERPVQALHALMTFFMKKLSVLMRYEKFLSNNAISTVEKYSWPGNVRELAHVLKRAFVFSSGPVIGADDICKEISRKSSDEGRTDPAPDVQELSDIPVIHADILGSKSPDQILRDIRAFGYKTYRDRIELFLFELAMREHGDNKSLAADSFGMDRSGFVRKLLALRAKDGTSGRMEGAED
ncbi:MAG: sigma 54-interacting transcriptional regulator [Patescibacteria group bacterium]